MERRGATPWDDRQRVLAERLYRGNIAVEEIAARLERSRVGVAQELARMGARRGRRRAGEKLRNCLACGDLFVSKSFGNRVCAPCKRDEESAFAGLI